MARVERWNEVREVQMLVSLSVVQLALFVLFAAHVIGTATASTPNPNPNPDPNPNPNPDPDPDPNPNPNPNA